MKKLLFLLFFALPAMLFLLGSCGNDDDQHSVADTNATLFTSVDGVSSSRSNGPRKIKLQTNNQFYWTYGDYLFVETPTGFVKSQNLEFTPRDSMPKLASFIFLGSFPNPEYTVYAGRNFTTGGGRPQLGTTIMSLQTQSGGPNTTNHFSLGTGIGATATARKQEDGSFNFKLEHKVAYLKIFPYAADAMPGGYYLSHVNITAKDANGADAGISGILYLDGRKQNTSSQITLSCSGSTKFWLGKDSGAAMENTGCYVAMIPGEYQLTMEYTIKKDTLVNNTITSKSSTITKRLSLRNFLEGTYTNIRHKLLNVISINGDAGDADDGDADEIEAKPYHFINNI